MNTLEYLTQSLETTEPTGKDLSEYEFDKIEKLLYEGQADLAFKEIKTFIDDGFLDVRLMTHLLYIHFLKTGSPGFIETLDYLSTTLLSYKAKLKPTKEIEKHSKKSIDWFLKTIATKLKYYKKLHDRGKNHPFWEKLSEQNRSLKRKEFQDAADRFETNLATSWLEGVTKKKVEPIITQICAIEPPPVKVEETQDDTVEEESTTEEKQESITIEETPLKKEESSVSAPMQVLIDQLKAFEKLIAKEHFEKAAICAWDITNTIEKFDPLVYLPTLFSNYFKLMAKHAQSIEEQWGKQGTLTWKLLDSLYKSDLNGFIGWQE